MEACDLLAEIKATFESNMVVFSKLLQQYCRVFNINERDFKRFLRADTLKESNVPTRAKFLLLCFMQVDLSTMFKDITTTYTLSDEMEFVLTPVIKINDNSVANRPVVVTTGSQIY